MSTSSSTSSASAGGVGFVGLLTVAFIVLKLVGVVDWSWVWVLSPLWISAIPAVLIMVVILIIAAVKS